MALERFFEDLSNGHGFFINQAFGSAEISKTSCPVFFLATVNFILYERESRDGTWLIYALISMFSNFESMDFSISYWQ